MPKKPLKDFKKILDGIFQNSFWILKLDVSFKKNVTGPAIFAKLLVRKSKWPYQVFLGFFYVLKSVDLTFQFWVSSLKNIEFMDKIVGTFLLKLAHK